MKFKSTKNTQSGFTLVELIIVSAIAVTIFIAIFSIFRYSLSLIANSRARMSAMSLATERIEYFRSLSYYDVGTVGGPVYGDIPNENVMTLNGIKFYEDVRVDFVDDPADGLAGLDSNLIINDYKKVEVEIEWSIRGATSSVQYTSNIVPVSVETAEGYGAIKVEVRDEDTGLPLEGVDVRVTNDTLSPAIDFTRTTGPSGVALMIVPEGSGYHASSTKANYSFDKTYEVTVPNPNPSPNSFLVEEALISDRPFRIGELSDIDIKVYSDITDVEVEEDFDDASGIVVNTSVAVNTTNDTLELAGSPGSYVANGSAELVRMLPVSLVGWKKVIVVGSGPSGSQYDVQFYTGDCTVACTLVNNSDLPGNSSGITDKIIDLTALDISTYPDLTMTINLQGDTTVTPSVSNVAVYYRSTETTSVGTSLTMHGEKVIGAAPDVYKTDTAITTDASGEVSLLDTEYDEYTLENGSLTATRVCSDALIDNDISDVYFTHDAGINTELEIVLENTPTHTLRGVVVTDSGEPLPGAEVLLEQSGFSETAVTDSCGQAFINNTDGVQSDYDVTVSRDGYTDYIVNGFTVDGDTKFSATLSDS